MGVPVVTLRGERFVSREAAGILTRTGHPEWIASTPDEYVEILRTLAADREKLATTRATLRADLSNSPVHDPVRLAREMERFFLTALGVEADNA
jgi:predicted O-linked N-acetylglucosamine transferase (SPINDLY family)